MSIEDKDEKKKHFEWQFDGNYLDNIYSHTIFPHEDSDKPINPADIEFSIKQPNEVGAYVGYEAYNPLKTLTDELDDSLSNIHEPISEHDKRLQEMELAICKLQLNDEQKDILIQELQEQLLEKNRENKSKSKSKSRENKLRKEVKELKKIVKSHQNDWRFTKDMHKEESKDVSQE